MLTIVDNEEFYEQEKPLSLKDIRYLIIILRQVILLKVFCKCMNKNVSSATFTEFSCHTVTELKIFVLCMYDKHVLQKCMITT